MIRFDGEKGNLGAYEASVSEMRDRKGRLM